MLLVSQHVWHFGILCAGCASLASAVGVKQKQIHCFRLDPYFYWGGPVISSLYFYPCLMTFYMDASYHSTPKPSPAISGDFHVFQQPRIESPTLLEKLPSPDLSLQSLCLGYKCRHGFVASYLDNKSTLSSFYERPPQHLSLEMWKHGIYGRGGQKHILHFISWKPSFSHNSIFTFNFKT